MVDINNETKKKMSLALEHFKQELRSLRTGRANPGMVDHVSVEVYGSYMRITDMASISVPEARQILITPFDANNVHAIAKGIEKANLNLQPIVDGNVVRIKVPAMDAAVRQDIVKQAKKKCEDCKVTIRNIRREANDQAKKLKTSGDLTEDGLKKIEKNVQELTDQSCKTADEMAGAKEKEILAI